MATKLKKPRFNRVAVVDEGANPDAHIVLAKNHDAQQEQNQPDEAEQGVVKRVLAAIAKMFGIESEVDKSAHTFAEAREARDYEAVIDKEIYPMHWAMMDSVRSILFDSDIDDVQKDTLLRKTLSEYSEAFASCAASWAKAELADKRVAKGIDIPAITNVRDHLNELINKSCDGGDSDTDPAQAEDAPEEIDKANDTGSEEGAEPTGDNEIDTPVEKGATDMIFDTAKMTPEEKAQYEDLAKRFGHEEPAPEPTPQPVSQPAPATEQADDGDVYKGLNPAVKAELEALRKFREEQEDRQYMEIAKKYALLGKKPEELAPMLKSLKALGGTHYDDMIALLDSNLSTVEQSGMFGEIGKRGTSSSGSAIAKVEAAASEIMKSRTDLTRAQAIDLAFQQHPELIEEYEQSR